MKTDPYVDFNNDWKLVTILSGNNDLCEFCKQPVSQLTMCIIIHCSTNSKKTHS
jgi:hypothetical protein